MNNQIDNDLKDSTKSVLYLPPQGLSRAKDILPFLPFGRTTLHEWSKEGRFPASIKLSPTMVAWRNAEVLEWLETQSLEPSNNQEVANDEIK